MLNVSITFVDERQPTAMQYAINRRSATGLITKGKICRYYCDPKCTTATFGRTGSVDLFESVE